MTTLLGRHHDDLFSDEGAVAQGVTSSHIPATSRGRITPETHGIHLSLHLCSPPPHLDPVSVICCYNNAT